MLDYYYQQEMRDIAKNAIRGQFIAPTGTGKSRVQANIISDDIIANPGFGVYLVLTPRILLTNQLMDSVAKPLVKQGIKFRRVTVHSGTAAEVGLTPEEEVLMSKKEKIQYKKTLGFSTADSRATTSTLVDSFEKAQVGDHPIVMCGTYHSVNKVTSATKKANIRLNIVMCDEAQYATQPAFHKSVIAVTNASNKNFFFTATRKVTASDEGRGMNNVGVFGEVLAEYKPIAMINQGYIVRPRLHFVDVTGDSSCVGEAVIKSFDEHRLHVKGTAKMLVSCAGSEQLKSITSHSAFVGYVSAMKQQGNPVTVFEITSAWGANINGVETDRDSFLAQLRSHRGLAIVLHLHILTEGIDVPDMTGVLMLSDPKESKFFQTVGRTTRLDVQDRAQLEAGAISTADLTAWNKPYCYVITPVFSDEGADQRATIKTLILKMRDYANDMQELILESQTHGTPDEESSDTVNDIDTNKKSQFGELFEIIQYFENLQKIESEQKVVASALDDVF